MGAKASRLLAAALLAAGCSGGLERLAPPGLVKYEDLAKGEPVDPAIAARMSASERGAEQGFPNLAAQPGTAPEGIAKPEREAMIDNLLAARDGLAQAVAADRALAADERTASPGAPMVDGSIEDR
jgi:hypothetical protein